MKRISWLSIVGLSISLGSLIIVISVMNALNQNMRKRTLAFEPHLVVQFPELKSTDEIFNHPVTQKLKLDPTAEVSVFESTDIIVRSLDGHFRGAVAEGITPEIYASISKRLEDLKRSDEVSIAGFTGIPEAGEVDLGADLARSLGVFEGDSIIVVTPESLLMAQSDAPKYEQVRVRRILATTVAEIDAQVLFYQRGKTLASLKKSSAQKLGLQVRLADPFKADEIKNELAKHSEVTSQTWMERNSALFFALKLEKSVIGVFLSLASLLAGFSLISALTLLISQKRKDIGILSAIGISKIGIQKLFSSLGFILVVLGLGGGLVLGLGISLYLQAYPLNVLPEVYYDSQVPALVDPFFVLMIVITVIGLGWLGSKSIAKQAAEINPSEALRSKIGTT